MASHRRLSVLLSVFALLIVVASLHQTASDASKPHVVFSHRTPQGSPVHASPVVVADMVLYSTLEPDCAMYIVNVTTGDILWRYQAPRRDSANPTQSRCGMRTTARFAAGTQLIHTGTDNNTFIAIDIGTKSVVWQRLETSATCKDGPNYRPCEVYSTALLTNLTGLPAGAKARIQGSEDGIVRCFNSNTGAVLWAVPLGSMANGTPVLHPRNASQFFIGDNGGFLHLMEVATGRVMGRVKTCGCVDTEPSLDFRTATLFYTCFTLDPNRPGNHPSGAVGAVDTHSLETLWVDNSSTGVPSYLPTTDLLYVGYNNGTVAALHPANGTIVWVNNQVPGKKEFFGSFVFDGARSRLYGANTAGDVVALDTGTGNVVWTISLGHPVAHQLGPAMSSDENLLFVGDYGGTFTALSLAQ